MEAITTRRVVTGHDDSGKAIIERDEKLVSLNPRDGKAQSGGQFGVTQIWKTEGVPARVNEPFFDWYGQPLGITDPTGVICRVIHFPPPRGEVDELNIMHRTQSVDWGIVLDGEIELHLDDGLRTTLRKGDIVCQRGTNHQWVNASDETCVVAFILVPTIDKAIAKSTGEILPPTEYPSY